MLLLTRQKLLKFLDITKHHEISLMSFHNHLQVVNIELTDLPDGFFVNKHICLLLIWLTKFGKCILTQLSG